MGEPRFIKPPQLISHLSAPGSFALSSRQRLLFHNSGGQHRLPTTLLHRHPPNHPAHPRLLETFTTKPLPISLPASAILIVFRRVVGYMQKHDTKRCRQERAGNKRIFVYPVHQCRNFTIQQQEWPSIIVDVDAPDLLSEDHDTRPGKCFFGLDALPRLDGRTRSAEASILPG